MWKISTPNVTHRWGNRAESVPTGERGTRSRPQASDSISFVICSFVFMQQSKWKLVLDAEDLLPRAAYSVTICIHIKFFFTYKSVAKHNRFGEWHVKCQALKNATAHTSRSWQRHSFQNISLYLLIMPKKAKGIPDAHTSDFFVL